MCTDTYMSKRIDVTRELPKRIITNTDAMDARERGEATLTLVLSGWKICA